jgi:hypothetical protein
MIRINCLSFWVGATPRRSTSSLDGEWSEWANQVFQLTLSWIVKVRAADTSQLHALLSRN